MYIKMDVNINIFICLFVCSFYQVKTEYPLEDFLKVRLKIKENINCGRMTSNFISNCSVYRTEDNKLIFVKESSNNEYEKIFKGEFEGLKAIRDTKSILAPKPIATGRLNNGHHFIAMEYLNMSTMSANLSSEFGSLLANMHKDNLISKKHIEFGFHTDTYCGFISQNNTWTKRWVKFFIEYRLEGQVEALRKGGKLSWEDKMILVNYWSQLRPLIKKFFKGVPIRPSLLHGDLWKGNVAQTNSKPVIFDPASFYGHHEYDIASSLFFGEYPQEFYDAYYKKIPKAKGYENRVTLYHLFHYLHHWNSYGEIYLTPTLKAFITLLDVFK